MGKGSISAYNNNDNLDEDISHSWDFGGLMTQQKEIQGQ